VIILRLFLATAAFLERKKAFLMKTRMLFQVAIIGVNILSFSALSSFLLCHHVGVAKMKD